MENELIEEIVKTESLRRDTSNKLTVSKMRFCELYAESHDSLLAYRTSHKNVEKARASILLQSSTIWKEIFRQLQAKDAKTPQDDRIIHIYTFAKEKLGRCPFDAYEAHLNQTNPDTIDAVRSMAYTMQFFIRLNRSYFLSRMRKVLNEELEYIDLIGKKNKKLYEELRRLKAVLLGDGIVFDDLK